MVKKYCIQTELLTNIAIVYDCPFINIPFNHIHKYKWAMPHFSFVLCVVFVYWILFICSVQFRTSFRFEYYLQLLNLLEDSNFIHVQYTQFVSFNQLCIFRYVHITILYIFRYIYCYRCHRIRFPNATKFSIATKIQLNSI